MGTLSCSYDTCANACTLITPRENSQAHVTGLDLNGSKLLRLPLVQAKETFLAGFWEWVSLLSSGQYEHAVESLLWRGTPLEPSQLEERLATFWGNAADLFTPVIPNDRLVQVINHDARVEWRNAEGWGLAQIPVTNEPARCKEDDVPLVGIATSFFIRRHQSGENAAYVLEFEIFHA